MRRILVADDEANMRWVLERALTKAGYEVETVEDGQLAIDCALAERPDLVLVDLKMPKIDGLSVLHTLKEYYPDLLLVMMTAHGNTSTAVEAMKAGAQDYLMKPFDIDELLITVAKAFEVESLREQVDYLKGEAQNGGWQLVGNSVKMQTVKHLVERVAPTPATVLIQGESGTGKELVANAIHTLSPRVGGPFIRVNCAALTETLLESELFGHEKGAFTGANARKTGRFELADSGTLFLDEIGELSFNVQAKLLRVLQERTFERVGGEKTIKVDVRIIAATNRDLLKEAQEGRFREDLYYRLNVFPIFVPPLRERREDIPGLSEYFLEKLRTYGGSKTLTPEVLSQLMTYTWPGNVRELENVVERMVIISLGAVIGMDSLPLLDTSSKSAKNPESFVLPPEGVSLEEIEKSFLQQAMEQTGGNQSQAAKRLGLSRHAFFYRLEKYGIDSHWGI
ncbi:response regulator with CheY-like receiver, AAA-type ATPase, and DNA-binding domains [Desulfosporosinus acidiphilus SJ4]|uniref:Stage 0 sporulation protein A homolog n=1 Tax=Desulfosporosinus acidiphilus (strain DSM 22704 / JCM 16185 / SJ4) TaxID=646529 RepID=I4DAD8_DESAJ|nr:sigma-54 dependent transcriptional regulator [Desulfosporosinus acidiphilus]AFM42762.1 response regulator with CheY-like receiver, AAA-type ATPase, and DNA-binding domains [Desulfosporosinus acidiphilus SJ4]